ncbi:MAG: 6-phosphogluconolactonase [Caldilineaceae bacterium]
MNGDTGPALPPWFDYAADELAARSPVAVRVLADGDALHADLAEQIAGEIAANNATASPSRLILPVGPVRQYPLLAQICNQRRIDWGACHLFLMDEYCDWQGRRVAPEHPLSFNGFFLRELVQRLDPDLRPPMAQLYLPDPRRLDDVSESMAALGGIDTCYGGIGIHGHVAFNEPPLGLWRQISAEEFRNSAPRLLSLNPETVVMNASRGAAGFLPALPPMAVTLGMREVAGARRIRLYCQGGVWQRAILRIALFGSPTSAPDSVADFAAGEDVRYPVTLLRSHPDLALTTDMTTAQPALLERMA